MTNADFAGGKGLPRARQIRLRLTKVNAKASKVLARAARLQRKLTDADRESLLHVFDSILDEAEHLAVVIKAVKAQIPLR